MNVAPCFLRAGLSLKRWSMVFVLAMAAIYSVMPGVARADFTMQYTGAAFDQNTFKLWRHDEPSAVLTNGSLMVNGAMRLNFWPFAGALTTTP
jgi:hypothetical protein